MLLMLKYFTRLISKKFYKSLKVTKIPGIFQKRQNQLIPINTEKPHNVPFQMVYSHKKMKFSIKIIKHITDFEQNLSQQRFCNSPQNHSAKLSCN